MCSDHQEADTKVIRLDEEDPNALDIAIKWIYCQGKHLARHSEHDSMRTHSSFLALTYLTVKAYPMNNSTTSLRFMRLTSCSEDVQDSSSSTIFTLFA